jgi:hypothetical protein
MGHCIRRRFTDAMQTSVADLLKHVALFKTELKNVRQRIRMPTQISDDN